MKILIVDYICTRGHLFFNEIHLDALIKLGHNLSFITRKGYIDILEGCNFYDIPEKYYKHKTKTHLTTFQYIYYDIKKLLFAKKVANKIKPDAVIVLTYDALSLAFFRIKYPTFIINHVNVDFLSFWYRNLMTKFLPNYYIHVCLTQRTNEYLKIKLKNKKTVYIPHGYLQNSCYINERQNIIFCPSTSSMDEKLLNDIITNDNLNKFLFENKIQLIIKTNKLFSNLSSCISILNGYIDQDLYQQYVKSSLAIFLPYHKSFNYRASGIFHEAISYGTPIITSNIPTFDEYHKQILYKYQVNDSSEFLETLKHIIKLSEYYSNLQDLNPLLYWKQALDCKNL